MTLNVPPPFDLLFLSDSQIVMPKGQVLSLGHSLFHLTLSNGITLHQLSSGESGDSDSSLAVAVSMNPPIFSAAPLSISLVMCV